jgi:hypothetical protein
LFFYETMIYKTRTLNDVDYLYCYEILDLKCI